MKTLTLIAVLLATGFNGIVRAAVEVVPFRIEESRSVDFADDKVSRGTPSLKVTFSLVGPEAESSVRYGGLKLDEAVDDQGASLIPTNDVFNEAAKFKEYANAFFRKSNFGGDSQRAAPQAELTLAVSRRAATKIVRLRGSLSLAEQGTIQTIELPALKGAGKKALAIPEDAGVGVTVNVKVGEDVRSIEVEITGDESAVESLEVVDASGKKVSNGVSSWSMNGGPAHQSIGLDKPLDGSMKLVAKVAVNRKITKVPFDLKNIPLP
jgi:hypothetical protein